ncbi:MAG: hypothetical protein J0L84_05235, partial [Verrucomicrobia bacterium]|nr:hypothetical protein [Verrucomicrobiota bacterium]
MWFLCLGTALAQPDNDTFDRRERLRGNRIVAAGTTADASRDRWEAEVTHAQVGQGVVWWEWLAPGSGLLTVTAETGQEIWGIPFQGQLKFFEGGDPGALHLVGEILKPGPLTVPVEAGRSYSIAVVWDSRHPAAFWLRLALPMPPPNDSLADAEELAGDWVTAAGTLWDATPDFHGTPNSVWWRWTAPRAGWATIRSAQSGSGLAFRVWRADQNPGSDAPVSDSRPQGEDLRPNVASVLSFVWPVAAGQTFWIAAEAQLGGGQDFQFRLALSGIALISDRDALVTGETASITLSTPPDMGATWRRALLFDGSAVIRTNRDWTAPFEWSASRPGLHQLEAVLEDTSGRRWPATNRLALQVRNWVPPETNDRFEDRLRLPARTNLVIHPGRATVDPGEPGANGGSLWFEWMAEEEGRMMVSLPLYSPLAQITAFSGTSLETLQAVPLETTTNHWLRDWYLPVVAGQRGVFRISGDQRHPDSELILGFAVGPVPTNDDFASRIELPSGSFHVAGNNGLAIREPGEPRVLGRSVWYQWVAPAEGTLTLPGPPAYERQVFLYSGTQWPPAVRTPAATVANAPRAVYPVGEGIHYLICVTGPEFDFGRGFFNGGPFELRGLFSPSPINDGILSALEVQGDDLLISGSVAGAQPTTSLAFAQRGHRYLWYEWLASGSGEVLISLPVSFDGQVLVVDSAAPGAAVSTQTQPGQWVFRAEAGTRYRLGIGNAYGGPDEFQAALRVRRRAGNDAFGRRMGLSATPVRLRAASWQISIEPGEPAGGPPGAGSLWWTWRAPKSGWAALRSEALPALRVFTGSQLESLTEVPVTTDPPGDGLQEARFDAVGGTTYQIALMADPNSPFDLSVELDHSTFVIASPHAGESYVAGREAQLAAEPPDPSVDGILSGPVTVVRYPEFRGLPALGTLASLPGSVVLSSL